MSEDVVMLVVKRAAGVEGAGPCSRVILVYDAYVDEDGVAEEESLVLVIEHVTRDCGGVVLDGYDEADALVKLRARLHRSAGRWIGTVEVDSSLSEWAEDNPDDADDAALAWERFVMSL